MEVNHKEIGKDRFEIEDIEALDEKQLLDYQIAVMQWYREGGELEEQYHDDGERLSIAGLSPCWNWEMVVYFPVPKPSYKPYEKADPAWLVKTDEVMKVKNEDWFTRVAEINNTIKCETDRHLAIRTASGWLSVDEAFNCYEWYNLATGETRPFGEEV